MATNFAANWDTVNPIDGVAFNDIYLDGGQLALVKGVPELQQTTAQNLMLWKGEYDFDTFLGVPYRLILGNPNLQEGLITTYLQLAIMMINAYLPADQLEEYGIKEIVSIDFNADRVTRNTIIEALIRLNNNELINISTT